MHLTTIIPPLIITVINSLTMQHNSIVIILIYLYLKCLFIIFINEALILIMFMNEGIIYSETLSGFLLNLVGWDCMQCLRANITWLYFDFTDNFANLIHWWRPWDAGESPRKNLTSQLKLEIFNFFFAKLLFSRSKSELKRPSFVNSQW